MNFIVTGLHLQEVTEGVDNAIKAMVRAYYENYTDATGLEPEALATLEAMAEMSPFGHDVADLVFQTEKEINSSGGIRSDTDGKRHKVCTRDLWDEAADTAELRADQLSPGDRYREYGMDAYTIKSLAMHGDRVLITTTKDDETSIDCDTVVEKILDN